MTALTARQVLMVILCMVIFMCGMFATVFIMLPSYQDPQGSQNTAIVCIIIATLATIWFVKLCVDSIRDRRAGVVRGTAKVGGRFHVAFGLLAAIGGIACSWITYDAAGQAGGGVWTFYYGMIAWGLLEMFYGINQLRREREDARPRGDEAS